MSERTGLLEYRLPVYAEATSAEQQQVIDSGLAHALMPRINDGRAYVVQVAPAEERFYDSVNPGQRWFVTHALIRLRHARDAQIGEYIDLDSLPSQTDPTAPYVWLDPDGDGGAYIFQHTTYGWRRAK